jgi:hypothetical protein
MPIRFRCTYCNRLLGIATRKAGTLTTCPHCGYQITVPSPSGDDESKTDRVNLDDVEELLGRGVTEAMPEPAIASAPASAAPAAPDAPDPMELPPETSRPLSAPAPKVAPQAGSAVSVLPGPGSAAKSKPALPQSANPEERPLFEGDMDEILGQSAAPEESERPRQPKTSGMDALSLSEPARQIVLSAQMATLLMVAFVVLLAIAFAAGYFLAPKS